MKGRKKFTALICILGMIMVPSMGVMAAGEDIPGETPGGVSPGEVTPSYVRDNAPAGNQGNVGGGQGNDGGGQGNITGDQVNTDESQSNSGKSQDTVNKSQDTVNKSQDTVNKNQDNANESQGGVSGNQDNANENQNNDGGNLTDETKANVGKSTAGNSGNGEGIVQQPKLLSRSASMPVGSKAAPKAAEPEVALNVVNGKELKDGESYQGITWNKSSRTLEFDNVNIVVPDGNFELVIRSDGDVTILLKGDNYLIAQNGDIIIHNFDNALNIQGGGSLIMNSQNTSLGVSDGSLNITGVEVSMDSSDTSETGGVRGIGCIVSDMNNVPSGHAITITDSKVQGKGMVITSLGDINFNGKSVVKVDPSYGSAITAFGKMTFALTSGGSVTGIAGKPYTQSDFPNMPIAGIMSYSGIIIKEGNQIINPFDGKIGILKLEGIDGGPSLNLYYIADKDGNMAKTATVAGPKVSAEETGKTGTAKTAVVKNGLAGSIKTGDNAAAGLWLTLLLAAAGCVTVVVKAKKAR